MNEIEIYFNRAGNTVVGNYSAYSRLCAAIAAKNVFEPHGCAIKCQLSDLRRLVEYVQLFGNCIKTVAGFQKACELSGIKLEKA